MISNMKIQHSSVAKAAVVCLLVGCANSTSVKREERSTKWNNIYAGDTNLAGIAVWQLPREGCVYENRTPYVKGHPSEIDYFFWDGRVYGSTFSANGDARDKGWWPFKIKAGEEEWNNVDFSYGSDPHFQTHKDPRKKTKSIKSRNSCNHSQ